MIEILYSLFRIVYPIFPDALIYRYKELLIALELSQNTINAKYNIAGSEYNKLTLITGFAAWKNSLVGEVLGIYQNQVFNITSPLRLVVYGIPANSSNYITANINPVGDINLFEMTFNVNAYTPNERYIGEYRITKEFSETIARNVYPSGYIDNYAIKNFRFNVILRYDKRLFNEIEIPYTLKFNYRMITSQIITHTDVREEFIWPLVSVDLSTTKEIVSYRTIVSGGNTYSIPVYKYHPTGMAYSGIESIVAMIDNGLLDNIDIDKELARQFLIYLTAYKINTDEISAQINLEKLKHDEILISYKNDLSQKFESEKFAMDSMKLQLINAEENAARETERDINNLLISAQTLKLNLLQAM